MNVVVRYFITTAMFLHWFVYDKKITHFLHCVFVLQMRTCSWMFLSTANCLSLAVEGAFLLDQPLRRPLTDVFTVHCGQQRLSQEICLLNLYRKRLGFFHSFTADKVIFKTCFSLKKAQLGNYSCNTTSTVIFPPG